MAKLFQVVWFGRPKQGPWEALCSDYRQRIGRDLSIEDLPLRARTADDPTQRLRLEAEAARGAVSERAMIVTLDRRGRQVSSPELADLVREWRETWPYDVAFVIGSDLGLDADLVRQSRHRLSFGSLTLPHALARLVLYEQLYRALSIDRGIKYHRAPL